MNPVFLFSLFKCSPMSHVDNSIIEPKMSASFVPDHKAPMVLFLDRVYGIDNQDFLLHVLEVGFLPDMRAAASLDTVRLKQFKKYSMVLGETNNHVTLNSLLEFPSIRLLLAPQRWPSL